MTNKTKAEPRDYKEPNMAMPNSVHAAGGVLFEGSAVQFASDGDLENLAGTGTSFAGFLDESSSAEGDRLKVVEKGKVLLTVAKGSSWDGTEKLDLVYGTDGNVFTLVSTSAQAIGRVSEIVSMSGASASVWVQFKSRTHQDQA